MMNGAKIAIVALLAGAVVATFALRGGKADAHRGGRAAGKEIFRHQGFFSHDDILAKFRDLGVRL